MNEAAGPGLLDMLHVAGALAAVLALVVFAGWLLRRTPLGGKGGTVRVHERIPVARGVQLLVVHADGRRLLVGATNSGVNLVTELEPAGDEPATTTAAAQPVPNDLAGKLIAAWRTRRSK